MEENNRKRKHSIQNKPNIDLIKDIRLDKEEDKIQNKPNIDLIILDKEEDKIKEKLNIDLIILDKEENNSPVATNKRQKKTVIVERIGTENREKEIKEQLLIDIANKQGLSINKFRNTVMKRFNRFITKISKDTEKILDIIKHIAFSCSHIKYRPEYVIDRYNYFTLTCNYNLYSFISYQSKEENELFLEKLYYYYLIDN